MSEFTPVEHFAGSPCGSWIKSICFMNLLSENLQELAEGFIGEGMELTKLELDPVPDEFRDLIKPFATTCDDEPAFNMGLISDVAPPLGIYVIFHGHTPETGGLKKFRIRVFRKPEGSPPDELKKDSDALGGYPKGLFNAFRALGEPTLSCHAILKGWALDAKKAPLKFSKRKGMPTAAPLKLKHEKLLFDHPQGGKVELTFFQKTVRFTVESDITLKLDGDFIKNACHQLWEILAPIFKKDV